MHRESLAGKLKNAGRISVVHRERGLSCKARYDTYYKKSFRGGIPFGKKSRWLYITIGKCANEQVGYYRNCIHFVAVPIC